MSDDLSIEMTFVLLASILIIFKTYSPLAWLKLKSDQFKIVPHKSNLKIKPLIVIQLWMLRTFRLDHLGVSR